MMRKLLVIMIIAVFAFSLAFAAENSSANSSANLSANASANSSANISASVQATAAPDESAEIRIAHIRLMAAVKQTEMSAVISYVDEIGGNSSLLSSILGKFENQSSKVENMAANSEISAALAQLSSMAKDFRAEARKQIDSNNGKMLDAASRIQNAASRDSAKIKELEDDYYDIREENTLAILAKKVADARKTLERLDESGIETEEMQEILDEIDSLRTDMKLALEKRNDSMLQIVNEKMLNLSKELQNLTSLKRAEFADETALKYTLQIGERVNKNTKKVVSELKDLEINSTSVDGANDALKDNLDDIGDALEKSKLAEAKDAVKEMKASIEKIIASYKEIAAQKGLSKVMKGKLESLSAALDKVVKSL